MMVDFSCVGFLVCHMFHFIIVGDLTFMVVWYCMPDLLGYVDHAGTMTVVYNVVRYNTGPLQHHS